MKYSVFINYLIALVWLINGLICKVLNLVPRHQQIVGEILGDTYVGEFTFVIGISEMLMAGWIILGVYSRLNAIAQITIVASMNILEFILVPELLLWGRFNSLFASGFILLVYFNEFGKQNAYSA